MLKCAFYEKEITPPLGCAIPGYFNVRPGSDVKARLYARAFVTDDGENQAVLISVDGCTVDNSIVKPIMERITEFTGIPQESILIAYTHTHTGIPHSAPTNEESTVIAQEGYHTVFTKLIADCAILAYKHLEESSVEFAKGDVEGISFCRDYIMKNSTPRTNPPRMSPDIVGPCATTDNELPILFVKNSAGKPLGAVVSFACHPDTVSGNEYCGDYIGELAQQLKNNFGSDFVTVFLLGTCGDINHFDVSKASDMPDHHKMMGKTIAGEALKALAKAETITDTKVTAKKEIMRISRVAISDEKIADAQHSIDTIVFDPTVKIAADNTDPDQYKLGMAKRLMGFLKTTPEYFDVPVQYISIGDFQLFAFPCEVFCHFGKMVKLGAQNPKCMAASLCNASYGYIPTRDMYFDTIYESLPGTNYLDSEAGYLMAEKLLDMSK